MQSSGHLRTFCTIILTQTLSIIGSRISGLALGFYLFAQTGEATPLVMVSFFTMLPMVLASGISGVLADRWDRRHVMIIADIGQAVGSLLLLFSFVSGAFEVWHLYFVVALQSIFSVFQGPAFQASVTMLIPDSMRDRANAIQQLSGPIAGIIAPALAGVIYAAVGVIGAIVIDLVTFLAAMVAILLVHIPRPEQTEAGRQLKGSFLREMLGGFQYLWNYRPLLVLILQFSLVNFLIGGMSSLSSAYLLMRTDSEATLGVVLSVMNIGGLVGAIIIGVWGGTRPRIHTILPGLIVSGIFLTLFGASQSPVMLAVSLFFVLFPLPMVNALVMSILQAKVAPDVQGRVFSVINQVSTFTMPAAYLILGPLADQVFEPAVSTPVWETFAPIVGSGSGAGVGLMYMIAGVLMTLSTLIVYAMPYVRGMEYALPDFKPEAPAAPTRDSAQELPLEPAPTGD